MARDLTGVEATDAQAAVLSFIVRYMDENGVPPTVREIATGVGDKSPHSITGKLAGLEKRGLITRAGEGKSRSIRIVGREPVRQNSDSRTGENFAVNIVGEFVAFMIFAGGKMIESGLYPVESAVKMADQFKVPAELAVIDRIAALAAKVAAKKVPAKVAAAE